MKPETVRIVPVVKGREGQSFTFYAIQRVSDELYLNKSGNFTEQTRNREGVITFSSIEAITRHITANGWMLEE